MTSQPRHRGGSRRGSVSTGGWFASKSAPDTTDRNQVGFNNDVVGVGPVCDWDQRKVKLWGLSTTFNRHVNSDGSVTVTTSCDPPDMLLLARKGNASYWSGNGWNKDRNTRRAWSAGIAADMLQEGLVPAGYDEGVSAAMSAASSPNSRQPTSQAPRCALTADSTDQGLLNTPVRKHEPDTRCTSPRCVRS